MTGCAGGVWRSGRHAEGAALGLKAVCDDPLVNAPCHCPRKRVRPSTSNPDCPAPLTADRIT
jgi:hypothetical protein